VKEEEVEVWEKVVDDEEVGVWEKVVDDEEEVFELRIK